MKFIYTHHVRSRMRQRGMTASHIEGAIRSPERLGPSVKGRMVAQRRVGGRTCEVVYRKLNDHVVIITAYWLEEGA